MGAESALSAADLARRCAEETAKYLHRAGNETQFCFELLRRALAEQSADAFTHVYRVYEQLVTSWVYRHSRFARTGESAEYFTSAAFRSFYFALGGERFARFSSLAALLGYLKLCVHTAIAQYLREESHHSSVPLDDAAGMAEGPAADLRLDAADLWAGICRLLPDRRDQLLARCAFAQGLKPREIVTAYPDHWASTREVSVALYRIRRILRADPDLLARAGLAPARDASC